jgi:Tfp pilus assembly protein PilO
MKISKREMNLGIVSLATVLIGFTWYVIDSKTDTWKSKAVEIEKTRQQTRYYESAIRNQQNWMDELNSLQQDLRVFDTELNSVAPELMKTIKSISSKHNLEITRNNPRNETPTGDLFELGINCTWEGELESLVGFLADLQQQKVRYDVRSLNVKPTGDNSGKLSGNMLILCAYTRQPAAEKE